MCSGCALVLALSGAWGFDGEVGLKPTDGEPAIKVGKGARRG